jgi:hypothetical protein
MGYGMQWVCTTLSHTNGIEPLSLTTEDLREHTW